LTEAQLTKKIIDALKEEGAFAVKIHGGTFQSRGLPDVIGLMKCFFFGLEVKLPGKEDTITKLQIKKLRDIQKAGGIAAMVTSVDQALRVVRNGVKKRQSQKGT
jgi:Holliday junction resolvase